MFGSGRREGVITVLGLCVAALTVHAVGTLTGLSDGFEGDQVLARGMEAAHRVAADGNVPLWDPAGAGAPLWAGGAEMLYPPWWLLGRGHDEFWLPVLVALHAMLACAFGFRFLRAQGRSRYSSFVCGAAYGLGAHTGHLSANLPELAALAFAPLALEILQRIVRGERQRHVAPLLGPALTIPFWTGGVATAACTSALVGVWLFAYAIHERHRRGRLLLIGASTTAVVALLTAPMWLGAIEMPSHSITQPHNPELLQTVRRVVGPLLLFFAILGALRRQRSASTFRWLAFAGIGAAIALLLPLVPTKFVAATLWQREPDAFWWPVHFALVLLASNGLDDFLDLPLRRRAATAWTMVFATGIAPLGFVLGERAASFQVEAAVLFALAMLFAMWRYLGILRFKTVVASAALMWLAAATLHEQARAVRAPLPMSALPMFGSHEDRPGAPAVETDPLSPLEQPRARIAFDLFAADDEARSAAKARPTLGTGLRGLPADFVSLAVVDARVEQVFEGNAVSEYRVTMRRGRGALIVNDTWTPGWRATVDGVPTPLLATSLGARAVLLDGGTHTVHFDYQPRALYIGVPLGIVGGSFALLWFLVAFTRRVVSSRKNVEKGRLKQKVRRPPTAAKPAMATKALDGSIS